MAGELETAVRVLMAAFDAKDYMKMGTLFTDDAQGVDELSRRWMRGRTEMESYFSQFGPLISDVSSTMSDLQETVEGDIGLVTCWMEQDYKLEGEPQHFSGPMTVALRREGSSWLTTLIHAVPLAEA